MAKYDIAEAVEKLWPLVESQHENVAARVEAARELLRELGGLPSKVSGVQVAVQEDGAAAKVQIGSKRAYAWVNSDDGQLSVARLVGGSQLVSDSETEVQLAYDATERKLVGLADDNRLIPVPGKRRPRRDALALLTETIVGVLS